MDKLNDSIKAECLQSLEPLDFSSFLHGDEKAQRDFACSLISSLQTFGVAKLMSSDLPGCNITALFDMAKKFFSMNTEWKMVASHPLQPSPHRGYSFVGQENLSGVTGFAHGLHGKTNLQDVKFRALMEAQYEALEQIQLQVCRALALGLGFPKEFFARLHDQSHHDMRLLHYPSTPVSDFAAGKTRIADHTDFGSVTLLVRRLITELFGTPPTFVQDATGGLEGRHRTDVTYQAIESDERECLVILGDCFQRWTGDYLWAVPHRVTVPFATQSGKGEERIPERFSLAFFGKPNRDVQVGNLDQPLFQMVQYPSITAREYNNMKLVRTY